MILAFDIKTKILFAILVLFIIIETIFPNRNQKNIKGYLKNLSMGAINTAALAIIFTGWLITIANARQFDGLVSNLPFWPKIIITLIALDLFIYWWHRLNHEIPFLWRFHQVHHTDESVNATSALRFHVGEIILSTLVRAPVIYLLGPTPLIIIINEIIVTAFAIFHHANYNLPREIIFEKVIITPYLHQVHHSNKRDEHDRNYGVLFSFWDRIFKTRKRITPKRLGVDYEQDEHLGKMLTLPARKP
ncbi:MAG: sterol desaturase family protein [Nanoarchaeota archaeon]|nr:sterol desaturase family protein [Nanoarchaeota archaeon]